MVEWFVLAFPTWIDWLEWTLKFDQIMTCSLLPAQLTRTWFQGQQHFDLIIDMDNYMDGKSTSSSSFSGFIMNFTLCKGLK